VSQSQRDDGIAVCVHGAMLCDTTQQMTPDRRDSRGASCLAGSRRTTQGHNGLFQHTTRENRRKPTERGKEEVMVCCRHHKQSVDLVIHGRYQVVSTPAQNEGSEISYLLRLPCFCGDDELMGCQETALQ
jgi:hypothetical protein